METGLTLRVEIHLLAPGQGGRQTPIRAGDRPLCVVAAEDGAEITVGLCQLAMSGALAPGARGEADLMFAPDVSDRMRSLVAIGLSFDLAEGPHVIGRATVQAID
jgi:hypothetical protein